MRAPVGPGHVPEPPAWARELATVGVTGTNGKTTTTTWIAWILRALGRPVVRATTVGYYVDDDELPHARDWTGFVEAMQTGRARGARHAVIELTSEALARGFARAWPSSVGVFTNLSHDHLDAHGSPEHYLASKAQLVVSLPPGGTMVLNACDEVASLLREVVPEGVSPVTYGVLARGATRIPCDVEAEEVHVSWAGTRVLCKSIIPLFPREISVRGIGPVFAENALAAVLGAHSAGVPLDIAARAIADAPVPRGRFEVVATRPWVVVDYAPTPDALARTVDAGRQVAGRGSLFVVFGAGGGRDSAKRAPMGEATRAADRIVLTTDNPREEAPEEIARAVAAGLDGHAGVTVELDRARAIQRAVEEAEPEDVILVCGKGHEREQIMGRDRRPFDDVEIARAAHRRRGPARPVL